MIMILQNKSAPSFAVASTSSCMLECTARSMTFDGLCILHSHYLSVVFGVNSIISRL